jgi:hypothetical protein
MNDVSFRADFNNPVLLLAKAGNLNFDPEWAVYNMGQNTSYRVIVNNLVPISHPMHFHGHTMSVLAAGTGTWNGTVTRPQNPIRRDVQIMPPLGYIVFQVDADNPGVWPFHCHIAWHSAVGMYLNILERPNDIRNIPIPQTVYQTCRDWAAFTNTTIVDQIDSGQ